MRRLVSARTRAEEFAAAVEHRSPDGSAATAHADEYAEFLSLVSQLRDIDEPVLRPDFAADLRERLMAEAPEALADGTVRPRSRREATVVSFPASPRRRTATAVAAAAIVLGSTAGVAAASQSALPGETLYPVKRGIENIELGVARSDHGKGSEYLDQASSRLDEAIDLTVAHGDDPSTPGLVRDTLEDFASEADDGASSLMSSYRDDGDEKSISELRSFADESAQRLDALAGSVPSEASVALANAADVLSQLDKSAQTLCPDCSSLPTLSLSSALMELQTTTSAGSQLPTDPTTSGGTTPNLSAPTSALTNLPGGRHQPTGSDPNGGNNGNDPVLPTLPTAGPPTQNQPTNGTTPKPPISAGVSVPLPGGGGVTVGTSVPSVPTLDPDNPIGSIPDVVDDITGTLTDNTDVDIHLPGLP
jgi:Domain of unknown function (DUF5667)